MSLHNCFRSLTWIQLDGIGCQPPSTLQPTSLQLCVRGCHLVYQHLLTTAASSCHLLTQKQYQIEAFIILALPWTLKILMSVCWSKCLSVCIFGLHITMQCRKTFGSVEAMLPGKLRIKLGKLRPKGPEFFSSSN